MRSFLHVMTGLMLLSPLSHAWAAAPVGATTPVAAAPIPAAVDKVKFEQDIDQLLVLLHADVELAYKQSSEGRSLVSGVADGSIPKASQPYLATALKTAFAPDRFKRMIREIFIANISAGDVPPLLAWYGSDLGKKLILANDSVLSEAGENAIIAYRANPETAAPTEYRLKLLRQYADLTKAVETEDLMMIDRQKILVDGFAFYRKNSEETVKKIIAITTDDRAKIPQRTLLAMAYILRDFSDAELEKIVAFTTTAPAQSLVKAANLAERNIMADIIRNHLLLMMGQVIDKLDPP
jgi:hypothetical protein